MTALGWFGALCVLFNGRFVLTSLRAGHPRPDRFDDGDGLRARGLNHPPLLVPSVGVGTVDFPDPHGANEALKDFRVIVLPDR